MGRSEDGDRMDREIWVDSHSIGDPARYHALDDLHRAFAVLPAAPRDLGSVALLVRRGDGGRRERPERVLLTREAGLPGDAWGRKEELNPEAQLTVIQVDVAELIANGQPLTLFGDNLFFALDLSAANLPAGSR